MVEQDGPFSDFAPACFQSNGFFAVVHLIQPAFV